MNTIGRTIEDGATKWQSVVARIESEFAAGDYSAGGSFPTLRALCERHGISNTTGRRVVQEMKSRGYIAARGRAGTRVLRTSQQRQPVYLCLRSETLQGGGGVLASVHFIHEFMAGFAASEAGRLFELVPLSSDFLISHLDRFAGCPVLMSASVVMQVKDGRAQIDQPLADRLHARLQPIFFHGFPGLTGVIQLGTDLHASLAVPVRHLVQLGHTRIGLVLGDTRGIWYQARLQGYLDTLHEAGIGFAPERVAILAGPADAAAGTAELDHLLAPASGITAVACATDRHALAVLERCHRRGIRVPDDLAVTGSDDIPEASLSLPPLTSVNGRDRDKGAFAAELLQRRLGGEVLAPVVHAFEPQLVVRESSAAVAAGLGKRPRTAAGSSSKQIG